MKKFSRLSILAFATAGSLMACGPDANEGEVAGQMSAEATASIAAGGVQELAVSEAALSQGDYCTVMLKASGKGTVVEQPANCFKTEAEAFAVSTGGGKLGTNETMTPETFQAAQAGASTSGIYTIGYFAEDDWYNHRKLVFYTNDRYFCSRGLLGKKRLTGFWNDRISSFVMFGGCRAVLYRHWDWRGDGIVGVRHPSLKQLNFNDQASSLILGHL